MVMFALAMAAAVSAAAPQPSPAALPHIEAARAAAGPRWADSVANYCGLNPAREPRGEGPPRTLPATLPEVPNWPEAPHKIFDNLYFVGSKGVSAFAIDTRDGIIITDGMWAYDMEKSVVGGLTTLGLDPKRIKYVIIPHGHPDHYGGAQLLRDRFGAKIVAPKGDVETIKIYEKRDTTPIPKNLDILVGDGDTLTLGGTTVKFHLMPGHTPGGVVMSFPVASNGQPHRMLIWAAGGGTPPTTDGQKAQVPYLKALIEQAKATGIDALADNHGSHNLVAQMRADPKANPFLVGRDGALGYLTVRSECDQARVASAPSR